MKAKEIKKEKFVKNKLSGVRNLAIAEIKKKASDKSNKGKMFSLVLPKTISISSWYYIKRELTKNKIIQEVHYKSMKNKSKTKEVLFKV